MVRMFSYEHMTLYFLSTDYPFARHAVQEVWQNLYRSNLVMYDNKRYSITKKGIKTLQVLNETDLTTLSFVEIYNLIYYANEIAANTVEWYKDILRSYVKERALLDKIRASTTQFSDGLFIDFENQYQGYTTQYTSRALQDKLNWLSREALVRGLWSKLSFIRVSSKRELERRKA